MFKKKNKIGLTYAFLFGALTSAFAIPIHKRLKERDKIIDLNEEKVLIGSGNNHEE